MVMLRLKMMVMEWVKLRLEVVIMVWEIMVVIGRVTVLYWVTDRVMIRARLRLEMELEVWLNWS